MHVDFENHKGHKDFFWSIKISWSGNPHTKKFNKNMILTCDTQGAPGKNKYKPPLEAHVPNPGCTSFSHTQLQGRRTHNPKLQNI